MLYVVATPIGNVGDLSVRAIELLKSADMVIGEEMKEVTRLLKAWKATGRPIELLNEHSDKDDIQFLLEKCRDLTNVVLVSDCGTPGFCDPGAQLVAACRNENIEVRPVPGASSLMGLLSVCGHRLDQFLFRGFLPAKTDQRQFAWEELANEKRDIVLMDTPYRLSRTLDELDHYFSERKIVLGLSLTQEGEVVVEGTPCELKKQYEGMKAEFILIILAAPNENAQYRKDRGRPRKGAKEKSVNNRGLRPKNKSKKRK